MGEERRRSPPHGGWYPALPMGLRLRLLLVLILPLILVVAAYGLLRIRQEGAQVREAEARNAAITARAVQIAVEHALRDRPASDLRALLAQLVDGQDHVARIRVFDLRDAAGLFIRSAERSGTPAAHAARRGRTRRQPRARRRPRPGVRARPGRVVCRAPRRGAVAGARARAPRRGHDLHGAIEITFATEEAARARATTRQVLVRVGLLTLALALLTGAILQRQLLRPLSRLAQSIRALGEGRPGPPLPIERRDELGAVAEAFNRMAERLEAEAPARRSLESEHALDLERQLRQARDARRGRQARLRDRPRGRHAAQHHLRARRDRPARAARRASGAAATSRASSTRSTGSAGSSAPCSTRAPRKAGDSARRAAADARRRLLPLLEHVARKRGMAVGASSPRGCPRWPAIPASSSRSHQPADERGRGHARRTGRIAIRAWRRPARRRAPAWPGGGRHRAPASPPTRSAGSSTRSSPPSRRARARASGLAICRDIVRDHGGTLVAAEPRRARAPTFTVWLPEA